MCEVVHVHGRILLGHLLGEEHLRTRDDEVADRFVELLSNRRVIRLVDVVQEEVLHQLRSWRRHELERFVD